MRKTLLVIAFASMLGGMLSLWLTLGIVKDPEFAEYSLQWKARPTFKLYFYSPTGMSDLTADDLPPELRAEQLDYEYYVLGE